MSSAGASHVIARLPVLVLFPHSRCNCRCVMCDIWKVDAIQEISAAELDRHVEDIRTLGVEWVVFSGGEPLMHSDLFRLCERLRGLGLRLTILSTGLLVERHCRRIVEHVDDVIVSLDGPPEVHDRIRRVPGAFRSLASGVAALRRLQPDYPIAARCTVQKLNCTHLRETVKAAQSIGLTSLSFLAADLTSDAFNRPQGWPRERQLEVGLEAGEVSALADEIELLIRERSQDLEGGFIVESPEKLRRIVRHFATVLGLEEPVAPRCNAPWVSAVIESDGTVRPCFFHRPIGRLEGRTLGEVVNSPEAIQFRAALDIPGNPICRRCVCALHYSDGWRDRATDT